MQIITTSVKNTGVNVVKGRGNMTGRKVGEHEEKEFSNTLGRAAVIRADRYGAGGFSFRYESRP
jgi:hypothetical protein